MVSSSNFMVTNKNALQMLHKTLALQGKHTDTHFRKTREAEKANTSTRPEEMMTFVKSDVQITDGKKIKVVEQDVERKSLEDERPHPASEQATDTFGRVIDPVKLYLREIGLVSSLIHESEVEIAKDVRIKVMRSTISNVMVKGAPVAANDTTAKKTSAKKK